MSYTIAPANCTEKVSRFQLGKGIWVESGGFQVEKMSWETSEINVATAHRTEYQ